jgi:hypothetical protein
MSSLKKGGTSRKRCDISADIAARRATDHGQLAHSMGPKQMIETFKLNRRSPADQMKLEKILSFLAEKYNDLMVQGNLGECREIIEDMILADQEFEDILRSTEQMGGRLKRK